MSVAGVSMSRAPKSTMPVTRLPVNRMWSCQMSRMQGWRGSTVPARGASWARARGMILGSSDRNCWASGARSGKVCVLIESASGASVVEDWSS